jgi:hypothetical protein
MPINRAGPTWPQSKHWLGCSSGGFSAVFSSGFTMMTLLASSFSKADDVLAASTPVHELCQGAHLHTGDQVANIQPTFFRVEETGCRLT